MYHFVAMEGFEFEVNSDYFALIFTINGWEDVICLHNFKLVQTLLKDLVLVTYRLIEKCLGSEYDTAC